MHITVQAAAQRAGVTEKTIHNWLIRGHLTRYRQGRRVYLDADELDTWLTPVQE